jgi:hypothetical protein
MTEAMVRPRYPKMANRLRFVKAAVFVSKSRKFPAQFQDALALLILSAYSST